MYTHTCIYIHTLLLVFHLLRKYTNNYQINSWFITCFQMCFYSFVFGVKNWVSSSTAALPKSLATTPIKSQKSPQNTLWISAIKEWSSKIYPNLHNVNSNVVPTLISHNYPSTSKMSVDNNPLRENIENQKTPAGFSDSVHAW